MNATLATLLTSLLAPSLLFVHDPSELASCWLSSLPLGVRGPHAEVPDDSGINLKDEREPVLSFLEGCLVRCARTPHRYLEELDGLLSYTPSVLNLRAGTETTAESGGRRAYSISPLMATCLEQLSVRVSSSSSPLDLSDLLAIATFLRRVIVSLLGSQSAPDVCGVLAGRLEEMVFKKNETEQRSEAIERALRKECGVLRACIRVCAGGEEETRGGEGDDPMSADRGSDEVLESFLTQIESSAIGTSISHSSTVQAYELVDWLRLLDRSLPPPALRRVASVVRTLHPPALCALMLHLNPSTNLLWALDDDVICEW